MYELLRSCLPYCLILVYFLSPSTNAATLPSLIPTNTKLNLIVPTGTNLTAGIAPDLPNDVFGYTSEYGGPLLPDIPCMMVCVFAMRELALLPGFLRDHEIPGKTWIVDDYPQVALSVGGPSGVVTVRFAVYIIEAAIRDMMTRNQFQTSQFVGTWLGVRVVNLEFFAPNAIETPVVKAVPTVKDKMATVSIDISHPNLNATSNKDRLRAVVTYKTKEISQKDMFMAIIWAILTLAPLEDEERIRIETITDFAITASVTIYFVGVTGIPRGVQPLQYGDLISLLATLPETLLREGVFREMDIVVKDGNVVVGKGLMRLTTSSGFVGVPLIANVSAS